MNKGDKIEAVFNPPEGIRLNERQRGFIGKELMWKALWADPDHADHWIMCRLGCVARGTDDPKCNTVTSAYLNQTEVMTPKERAITLQDIEELDKRIEAIQIRRDTLAGKLTLTSGMTELDRLMEQKRAEVAGKALPEDYEALEPEPVSPTTGGQKFDNGKTRLELLPIEALKGTADVLTFGAQKYADRNWEKGISYSRVYGAMLRHMTAWWVGEDTDNETGLSHLHHAGCCVMFLQTYVTRNARAEAAKADRVYSLELDDRPK